MVKGGAADRVFYMAGERPGPSDLIRWLARVAAARVGGRPAGAANSRPRPRFLGLGSGKGEAAAKVDRAKNSLGRKMSDGPNLIGIFSRN